MTAITSAFESEGFIIQKALDKASFAVLITDACQKIIYVNQSYEHLTGLSASEVLGKTPRINQSGRHSDAFYQKMWQVLRAQGHWRGEVWDRRKDGSFYLKQLSIEAVRNAQNQVSHYVAFFSDINEHLQSHEALEKITHYDPLTDLPNRILFHNRLRHEFNISNRHNARTGLLVLNIDRFRLINDAFGFSFGDELLIHIAKRLKTRVRSTDLLARKEERNARDADLVSRIGGDDFSFILSELRYPEDANVVARRLLNVFEEPFIINDEEIFLSCSIGIAVYPDNAKDEEALMGCAEAALAAVRADGKGGYRFFSDEMNRKSAERVRLEARLRRAVANHELRLHYQPKMDLQTGRYIGMEALLRWPNPDGSMTPPDEFIPLSEDTGLITPIGHWIIDQALHDTCELNQKTGQAFEIAINLSARQFLNPGLVSTIDEALQKTGINPALVEFEITESMLIEKVDEAKTAMQNLKQLGVKLAIDDFGTGYSSLSYLKDFPVDTLKIDRSFIADMISGDKEMEIVYAVISLGKAMGLQVVAEGVEHSEQTTLLKKAGCDLAQGFGLDRPMPFDLLLKLLS